MKRDKVVIFILVGVMLFSAVATGLLFIAQSTEDVDDTMRSQQQIVDDTENTQVCEASAEVASQAGNPAGDWPTTADTPFSSLDIIDTREGSGQAADVGNCITVHYRLSLADGTPIEGNDTFDGGSPIAFKLSPGSLIEGWVQGIPGLKEGGVRRLLVPAELAYGSSERPGIPANSDLIFDVELVKVEF